MSTRAFSGKVQRGFPSKTRQNKDSGARSRLEEQGTRSGAVAAQQPSFAGAEPAHDCALCPRLAEFRAANAAAHPDWFNGPVPSFGDARGELLIVGLAPGLKGANRTGRPFTGDFAGELLYATLVKFGFARGVYQARPDDGLTLVNAMITNAVRCVPPQNKPSAAEIATCRPFLTARIDAFPRLRAIVCLGRIAHESALAALGARKSAYRFAHGARHERVRDDLALFDSYHCSRYNTNTGKLTPEMFEAVFREVGAYLGAAAKVA